MKCWSRFFVAILIIVTAGLMVACGSSKPQATTAPSRTEHYAPRATPTPAAVEEQVVIEPQVASIPSVEVTRELPDLASLNEGGYLTDVFFDTDRYDLKQEAREILAQNAAWLQQYPTVRIMVEGHCDERNTREYNLALGERRASAVRDYLVFLGTSTERIQTISYGEERPFASGSSEEAWKLNRRSHFVIIDR